MALLAAALVAAQAIAGVGQARAAGEPGRTAPAPGADIAPALAAELERAKSSETIPVIVRIADTGVLDAVLARLPGVRPTARFRLLPGFAARLTREQIDLLRGLEGVVRIEPDPQIHALLDGATRWFGSLKARRDFGVDGDRDGDPRRYTRDDVVIAVIDTGIDTQHADLDGGKVIGWFDAVNNRPEPYDDHFHGTHVASIAAGEGDGDPAHQGVAPGAALVGIKVLAADGSGRGSDLVRGIEWAIENKDRYGIDILNMSLGTSQPSDGRDTLSEAIDRAVEAGLIAVVAAGNAGPAAGSVGSPGAAREAITVGAMADPSQNGFVMGWFSSRGPTLDGRLKPDIVAPGWGITAAKAGTRSEYATYSGTSMATPFVSGTIALMLDANPRLGPREVREILRATAVDWGVPGPDNESGYGRLDAYAAIARAAGREGTPPPVPAHRVIQDRIEPSPWTGAAAREYPLQVADARYPIGISLLIPDHRPFFGPDLNLALLDPSGKRVAESATDRREETIRYRPETAGTYRIRVEAASWLTRPARFVIDVSAGLAGTPPPEELPPPAPPPPPPDGGQVERAVPSMAFRGDVKAGTPARHMFRMTEAGIVRIEVRAAGAELTALLHDASGQELWRATVAAGASSARSLAVPAGLYGLTLLAASGSGTYQADVHARLRQTAEGRLDGNRPRADHRFDAALGGPAGFRLEALGGVPALMRLTVRDSSGQTATGVGGWSRPLELEVPVAPGALQVTPELAVGPVPVSYRLSVDLPARLLLPVPAQP